MDGLIVPLVALMAYLVTPVEADRVVLLPDADGKVGSVVVKSTTGEATLNTAYAAAAVKKSGAILAQAESEATVRTRYGSTLDATPPRPRSFTLHFVFGSSDTLTPESTAILEEIRTALANRPAPELTVIGHTDRVGSVEANDALSLKRAAAIKTFLEQSGLQASRVDIAGRGEREPLVPTADEVPEPKNRRVEISIR